MSTSRFIAEPNASVPPPPAPEAEVPPATASRAASRGPFQTPLFSLSPLPQPHGLQQVFLRRHFDPYQKSSSVKGEGSGGAWEREVKGSTFHDLWSTHAISKGALMALGPPLEPRQPAPPPTCQVLSKVSLVLTPPPPPKRKYHHQRVVQRLSLSAERLFEPLSHLPQPQGMQQVFLRRHFNPYQESSFVRGWVGGDTGA